MASEIPLDPITAMTVFMAMIEEEGEEAAIAWANRQTELIEGKEKPHLTVVE